MNLKTCAKVIFSFVKNKTFFKMLRGKRCAMSYGFFLMQYFVAQCSKLMDRC